LFFKYREQLPPVGRIHDAHRRFYFFQIRRRRIAPGEERFLRLADAPCAGSVLKDDPIIDGPVVTIKVAVTEDFAQDFLTYVAAPDLEITSGMLVPRNCELSSIEEDS